MNVNEPVAWMFRGYLYEKDPSDWVLHEHPNVPVIPLYTHPVKEPTVKEVMSKNCTCYKLGYSQLNNYAKVKEK